MEHPSKQLSCLIRTFFDVKIAIANSSFFYVKIRPNFTSESFLFGVSNVNR